MQGPINRKKYVEEIQNLATDYQDQPNYYLVQKMKDLILAVAHDHIVYGTPGEVSKNKSGGEGYRDE
jgi:hypothetical protein